MKHTLRRQRLGALFVAGWLLLNFPLLGLWESAATVAGIPLFPLALFVIWAGLIATVCVWMEGMPAAEPSASGAGVSGAVGVPHLQNGAAPGSVAPTFPVSPESTSTSTSNANAGADSPALRPPA